MKIYIALHIYVLIPLVEEYIDDIKEVWVHKSPELNDNHKDLIESFDKKANLKSLNQFVIENILTDQFSSIKKEAIKVKSSFILESIRQLRTFLELIPENKIREVYHGYRVKNWPEIKVLGPTKDFYDELFPKNKSFSNIVIDETIDYVNENLQALRRRNIELISHGESPCNLLKDDSSVKLTPTNKASIIFGLDKGKDRYLFTGDAGISSFKAIPNWEEELNDLHWLKIPHHGSDNNISREMIELMRPKLADNSGDNHQDQIVLDCISKNPRSNRIVRSTKTQGSIEITL